MSQVSKSDYRHAKKSKDPRVRQEFLDAIYLEDATEFISEVKYMEEGEKDDGDMDCCFKIDSIFKFPKVLSYFKPLKRARVRVFPSSFKDYSYEYFLSVLIDHEGHHARQDFQKPMESVFLTKQKLSSKDNARADYFQALPEIPAEWNQLEKATLRSLSQKERNLITTRINNLKGLVSSYAPVFGMDWKSDLSKILCHPPYDGTVREIYGIN